MPATSNVENNKENDIGTNYEEEPKNLEEANIIINNLKLRCRSKTEEVMSWKKAFALQQQQCRRLQKEKAEQLNYLTSQLLLLESRLMKKQKHVSSVIYQKELMLYRQQKIIETLSSRLIDHGIMDFTIESSSIVSNDFDDSDSAVVLEDVDSDCNSSIIFGSGGSGKSRCSNGKMNNDVTIVRSISDAIETNLKYTNTRRSNCFLRRPEVLETVYSVEEDPEPSIGNAAGGANPNAVDGTMRDAVSEKRDKFKNRTEKCMSSVDETKEICANSPMTVIITTSSCENIDATSNGGMLDSANKQTQVTNYNRVMSNHRNVIKPKDVKYKRINKAKSKSLEELRGRLRHWVERGTCNMNLEQKQQIPQPPQNLAQSYA